MLLESSIPHNIIISNQGQSIYIVPRKYEKVCESKSNFAKPASVEIAGLAIVRSEEVF